MSRESDRVPAPTNGHGPRLSASPKPGGQPGSPTIVPTPGPTRPQLGTSLPDMRFAVSPAQAAAGFGIIAGLILLVLGRRGRRR